MDPRSPKRPAEGATEGATEPCGPEEHPKDLLGVDLLLVEGRGAGVLPPHPGRREAGELGRLLRAVSVVGLARLWLGETAEGLGDRLEGLLGPVRLVLVRVQLQGQLLVRPFDVVLGC